MWWWVQEQHGTNLDTHGIEGAPVVAPVELVEAPAPPCNREAHLLIFYWRMKFGIFGEFIFSGNFVIFLEFMKFFGNTR